MRQQTPMQKMINWSIENAFNVTGENGTTIIAIDTEEMRLKFDLWLNEEKVQLMAAFIDGMIAVSSKYSHMKEIYYTIKYDLDDKTLGLFHYYTKTK